MRSNFERLLADMKAEETRRAIAMPDERAALETMFSAWLRLRDLGWREAMYAPKDGSQFQVIEAGSTGIFDCSYSGEWPDGHFMIFDGGDCYPTKTGVMMFRLSPEDEAKEKAQMTKATADFARARSNAGKDEG